MRFLSGNQGIQGLEASSVMYWAHPGSGTLSSPYRQEVLVLAFGLFGLLADDSEHSEHCEHLVYTFGVG